jgi:signal transduction histidine kinase
MNKASLVELRRQLDVAINSETPEAYAGLGPGLAEALRQLDSTSSHISPTPADELGRTLQALEDAWLKVTAPTAPLPGRPEHQARLSRLLDDVLTMQDFALSLAKGDLSPALKSKGAMAGGLKSLQASLRHVTWQTQMIAKGDFSQRIDFMGESSESFNTMTRNMAQARDDLQSHGVELAQANASLTTEIAERKCAENLIQCLNLQLKQKIVDLDEANQDLEAFSYSISHDLWAPLRAIAGYARMLKQDYGHCFDGASLLLLTMILDNARLMGELIEDILSFTRLGRQEIKRTLIDMTALARTVFAELKGWERERAGHLSLNDLPPAQGDRTLVHQVLINLLTNALIFTGTRQDAAITLNRWCEGDENIYSVTDNGVGFDMQYVDKLFNVFQRLHLSSEFAGTGVGLAIVHKIIQKHGGRVWAEGYVNEGATFYFSLPRASGQGR